MRPVTEIRQSIQRMVCTSCGAEANASCNCGVAYQPKSVRAAEALKANPEKSNRAIAKETGLSEPTVRRARTASSDAVKHRVGLDGKTRKLPEQKPEANEEEPDAGYDPLDWAGMLDFLLSPEKAAKERERRRKKGEHRAAAEHWMYERRSLHFFKMAGFDASLWRELGEASMFLLLNDIEALIKNARAVHHQQQSDREKLAKIEAVANDERAHPNFRAVAKDFAAKMQAKLGIGAGMGRKHGGAPRVDRDLYPTPPWPTEALAEHIELAGRRIWEPAAGRGDMAEALRRAGAKVCATDIADHGYERLSRLLDFTAAVPHFDGDGIVTNPPFGERARLAVRFVELGLERIADGGFLALLLPNDFDSAAGRRHLFADCPAFCTKIVLTKRIVWFPGPGASPKENHSWFVWRKPADGCDPRYRRRIRRRNTYPSRSVPRPFARRTSDTPSHDRAL